MNENRMPPPADQIPAANTEVMQNYAKRKSDFEAAFKECHQNLFQNKKLDSFKSQAVKNTEQQTINKLISSCLALNKVNDGEGFTGAIIIILRELLALKDRVNELDYQLLKHLKGADKKDASTK